MNWRLGGETMETVKCPYCDEELKVDESSLEGIREDETPMIECNGCGEKFEMPYDIHETLRAQRNYEDMAMLDFATEDDSDADVD
jgi:Zn ribbon nucleic-acid-binding protein